MAWFEGKKRVESDRVEEATEEFIPREFESALLNHLVGNLANINKYPLLMAIVGPPGHGKSFQTQALLDRWGVEWQYISGSELENETAGAPATVIRDRYRFLSQARAGKGVPTCLIIDDIDAGIGDFGGRATYTVNRQNASSVLMNLADKPTTLLAETVRRSAIVVTANDVTTLYPPLRRPARMSIFKWQTTQADLKRIVARMFSQYLTPRTSSELVDMFPASTPAFFQHVYALYTAELLGRQTQGKDPKQLLRGLALRPAGSDETSVTDDLVNHYPAIVRLAKQTQGTGDA